MRILIFVLISAAYPVSALAGIATIRVVDQWWRPFPGASVTFVATTDCAKRPPAFDGAQYADKNGLIEFEFENAGAYWLMVQGGRGFRSYKECVSLGRSQSDPDRAYFQVRVTLDPLDGPKVANESRNELALSGLTSLIGAYRDQENQGYQVGFQNNNLTLEGPDGKILLFPQRTGSTYSGEHGSITFIFRRGAPTKMRFEPKMLEATRDTSQLILELK
jgi:hypothetical protein